VNNYKKLKVWRKSQVVALLSYRGTRGIRGADDASFRRQLVTAAFSIPANIVEGNGRQTRREYSRHVRIAINSADELEYHLETVGELGLMNQEKVDKLVKRNVEVRKMLSGLLDYLDGHPKDP
jgi:four helix bundle protein